MNTKVRTILFSIFMIFFYAGFSWLGYSVSRGAYEFWVYGVEKEAKVMKLEHSFQHLKSSSTHVYQVEIEGLILNKEFCCVLEEGSTYFVVVVSNSEKALLGKKGKSFFETFVAYMGGSISAYLVLGAYLFFIIMPFAVLREFLVKQRALNT